jgi:regulator of sigma E protease
LHWMRLVEFVVPFVVVLGIVIFVHELGHFIMAKLRGVRVLAFSLGFGPAMLKTTRGETEYRLAWFPLGGYVQMAGDSLQEDGSLPAGGRDEYLTHPWYGRILIALAGPAANLVTAFLVMVAAYLVGVSHPDVPSVLGAMSDTSRACVAGLRTGDRVVEVGGRPVGSWIAIFMANEQVPRPRDLTMVVERGGARVPLTIAAGEREPVLLSLHGPPTPPVVGAVVTGMPAYKAGIKEGDRILAVNGAPVDDWAELPAALGSQTDRPVVLRVRRGGQAFDITVTPMNSGDGGSGRIGIEAPRQSVYVERYGLLEAVQGGFMQTGRLVVAVYNGMWLTVSRPLYYGEYVGGPVYIAQAAAEQARRGADSFLQFLAMINVAIMAFNLLPLPILDGGHIVLALLQAVRRRALSARGYVRFQKVGLVVIGAIFLLVLANDPMRILRRQQALHRAPQEKTVAPSPP